MLQTVLPGEHPLFHDDNTPVHKVHWIQTWLDEHNDKVKHLTWYPQSPDLNIIEALRRF